MAIPKVLSASTIEGDSVENPEGEDLGKIEEIMIDIDEGMVAYAVLSFGGFLGVGDKFFAVPWDLFTKKSDDHKFILNFDKEALKDAPGFDKDDWPRTDEESHKEYVTKITEFYGSKPYWERTRNV